MKINKLLTPYNYSKGSAEREIKYIVIHYVGATGSAEANCKYYASKYIGASAHYFVDFDGSIWQSVEDQDVAWHCGAKKYVHPECRNSNSIGIEMCVRNKGCQSDTSLDWYFEDATVQMAVKLTRELMEKYKIPADHVIRHYDVTGKICPNPYVYNHTEHTWDVFQREISSPEVTGAWVKDSEGRYQYQKVSGEYAANEWMLINHHWYLFGRDGYMVTGMHRWNGKVCDPDDGSGDRYFLENTAGADLEGACCRTGDNGALEIWYVE